MRVMGLMESCRNQSLKLEVAKTLLNQNTPKHPSGGMVTSRSKATLMNLTDFANTVIDLEGGYVNSSADSGGETKFGITLEAWNTYKQGKPGLRNVNVGAITRDMAIAFWVDRAAALNLQFPADLALPFVSFHGLAGSRAFSSFRKALTELYPGPSGPGLLDYSRLSQPNGKFSDAECDYLRRMTPLARQAVLLLARIDMLMTDTERDVQAIRATGRTVGTSGPVYINGWISRAFYPGFTSQIPYELKVLLGRITLQRLLALRASAGDLVLHPADTTSGRSDVRVAAVLTPTRSNFLWRDRDVQSAVLA
jgi:hypothetical protein